MDKVEKILGYKFNNSLLLKEALTHPSISKQNSKEPLFNYERLEFLGDSVLSLIIANLLITRHPDEREGALAKRHSGLVHGEALAKIAKNIGIGKYLIMAQSEASRGGRSNHNNIENALEAIIGAIYLDGGLEPASEFVLTHWSDTIDNMTTPPKDAKTTLQEWAQGKGMPIPKYEVTNVSGPAHDPFFTITAKIDNIEPAKASGKSKKKAEKAAAEKLLDIINKLESE